MRVIRGMLLSAVLLNCLVPSHEAKAWGPIGHRMVAETATLLLERGPAPHPWGAFLAKHRFALGYYSVLPDTRFRHIDGAGGDLEGPSHFLDLDLVFAEPATRPAPPLPERYEDFRKLPRLATMKDEEAWRVGSAPWRIEQFRALAHERLRGVKRLAGGYLFGKAAQGEARAAYEGLVFLGLLAHYTADSTVPHHATVDFNGYAKGQGGIHFFFESDCVNALEPGLAAEVFDTAGRKARDWAKAWNFASASTAEILGNVLADSFSEIESVEAVDRKKIIETLAPKGSRTFARRRAASESCGAFRRQLIDRLAKGAVLTAELWRRALPSEASIASGPDELLLADFETEPAYVPPTGAPASLLKTKRDASGKRP